MRRKVLGVSWLGGKLEAAVCQGRTLKTAWSCPSRVEHVGELAPHLGEAVAETGFSGEEVSLVLDHRHLIYHLQEAPPGGIKTVRTYLQRKVSQQGFFEEESVWSFHPPHGGSGSQRFLLTLLPRSILASLSGVCEDLGLALTGVYAPAAILAEQFERLHLEAKESALLVADLGMRLCLVAGQGNGQVLFARAVVGSRSQNRARAGQEINRTLLYVEQKFGVAIQTLWAWGAPMLEWLKELEVREGLDVRQSPVALDPHYFVRQAALLPPVSTTNLVPWEDTRHRQWRRWVAVGTAALVGATLATTLGVEKVVQAREAESAVWTHKWNLLERIRDAMSFRQREVKLLEKRLKLIGDANEPPVIDLFLRYVSVVLPESVTLSGFTMSQSDASSDYRFRLEGYAQETETPLIPLLERVESTLSHGLFQVRITDSSRLRIFGSTNPEPVRLSGPAGLAKTGRLFFIEGQIE
jgi:hypothetical protein